MSSSSTPPYTITPNILRKIEEIGKELGIIEASSLQSNSPNNIKLRKESTLKTIHSSLAIEGNTLSLDQVRSISEGQIIAGPNKDIKEVQNAIEVYKNLKVWNGLREDSSSKLTKSLCQN